MTPASDYLWSQIKNHSALFFSPDARRAINDAEPFFGTWAEAIALRRPCLAIPTDAPASLNPTDVYTVPFGDTRLTLWNRLPRPHGDEWHAAPGDNQPLWYRHDTGTLIPAWNLYGNLFGLLTLAEEQADLRRDRHTRFVGAYSPRADKGLLEIPAFNEAVAALVAATLGLQQGNLPLPDVTDYVKPPVVVLSHDCDILQGNDFWTQAVRLYRAVEPLSRLRLPRMQNLWWAVRNAFRPRDYYYNNVWGMIDLERLFACHSTFYLLNGAGGRFGARSSSSIMRQMVSRLPAGWPLGMHYNYDTFHDDDRFVSQQRELEDVAGRPITCGRAHYLRLDPQRSFPYWASHGIRIDESAGYPDRIGYRSGIGGCYQPFDPATGKALDFWELPLVVMEATLLEQYGENAVAVFERLLSHMSRIGGAVSLIVHPGMFFNPEFPETRDLYHRILMVCRNYGAVSRTAAELVASLPGR